MATKPIIDDLIGWLKLQSTPSDESLAVYQECFDAAVDDIESRIDNVFVLAQGAGDLTDDGNYPQKVRTAELLLASRLAKRQTSPEGVAGMSDMGVVVRILGTDPDIERLIRRFLKMDGFA